MRPALAGLILYAAGALAALPLLPRGEGAANQIRLDRPVGGGAAPAPAPPATVLDLAVEDTMRIMKGLPFGAMTIERGENGPYIRAVIDDQPTYIWHANCEGSRCRALHFAAYLGRQDSVDDAFVHDYNRNTLFTKMAKDRDGELQVTMAANLLRGVTEDHVRAMGESWIVFFREAVAYQPEGK